MKSHRAQLFCMRKKENDRETAVKQEKIEKKEVRCYPQLRGVFMELRVLRYFLMVAREENITRAAELLHITQPTLSRQLKQLEEELGTELFERSNHSIHLTEDGMLLKRRAQEMIELADKTKSEFGQNREEIAGNISIGSGEARSVQELADVIRVFQEKYPAVQYDLYTANADDIKERIDKGLLDIGLLAEPVDISKYNFIRLKQKERWGVLVRKDSELAHKSVITPEDLLGTPVFMPQRALVKSELEGWFGDIYDRIRVAGTYNLINNAAVMVEKKIGAALCFQFQSWFDNLTCIPLSPYIETGAVLVWRKSQVVSRTMHQFIQFIKEYREINE